jgi:hypothetical protein
MRVVPPLEITDARLTNTTVPDDYTLWLGGAFGATYSIGQRVGITKPLGVVDVYESQLSGNFNNPPATSPTWWKLIGSTYEQFEVSKAYALGYRLRGYANSYWGKPNTVYEAVVGNIINYPADPSSTPTWAEVPNPSLPLPALWVSGTPYAVDQLVYSPQISIIDGVPLVAYAGVWKCTVSNNDTLPPSYSKWIKLLTYPVPYVSTAFYDLTQIVETSDKKTYQVISNTYGSNYYPLTNPHGWVEVGTTNKCAMFDYTGNTKTVATSPLIVTLTPSKRVDSIDLSGMVNVKTVRVQITSGGTTVYDQTINTVKRSVMNYYDWFFQPFVYKKSAAKFDLPPYTDGVITVTFTSPSGNVEVGALILGNQFYVGKTQYNAVRDYTNYSTITREFDGSIASLVQRAGIPKTSQNVWVDKTRVQAVSDMLITLDATPAAWSGIDDESDGYFEPVHLVGIVKSAPIDMGQPTVAVLSLELEAISSN